VGEAGNGDEQNRDRIRSAEVAFKVGQDSEYPLAKGGAGPAWNGIRTKRKGEGVGRGAKIRTTTLAPLWKQSSIQKIRRYVSQ